MVKTGRARDAEVRRGGERNGTGRWMWPFPSTRCHLASHVNVCCRFGSVQVFAFAKDAPPNVRLLAGLDGGPVGDGSRIYLRTG